MILITLPQLSRGAAPDDINTSQRAWYDAVDVDGDSDYTDNPANNTSISLWNDKSGSNNHLLSSETSRPTYTIDSITTERHGLAFDGVNDNMADEDDIWIGSVDSSEIFLVLTTDRVKSSTAFGSNSSAKNRLSSHIPWGDNNVYFDQGMCCGSPTRLAGNTSINLLVQNIWHFIGLPDDQSVLRDGKVRLSDSGASVYTVEANSRFRLSGSGFTAHHGSYYEGIFYQTALNTAQRSILNNYLSAKWSKAFDSLPTYSDVYAGDTAANGDYDYFVGGIGQDNGRQTVATSQGLTISDSSFLTDEGKYILAGVDYLVSTPPTGTVETDLPIGYPERSHRSWYIDRTGDTGLVDLSFDAAEIGIPVDNGANYGLLHRTGTSGAFSVVATATMASGVIDFSYLPDDGVYAIGKRGSIALSLDKTSQIVSDPVNLLVNPKSIPGSNTDYTLAVKNTGDGSPDAETTIIADNIPSVLSLYTGDLDGNGSPFVFTDNSCPPSTNTSSSHLALVYPDDVIFKDASGNALTAAADYDSNVRSFVITLSGAMNASVGGVIPCFTIRYRTRLD